MGGKGSSGPSAAVQQGELDIAQQQEANSNQLYHLTEPGLAQTENFEQTLAGGDPAAIMRAIAPSAQAASASTAASNANIMANAPAGGEKNLSIEQNIANQGSEIAKVTSGATTGAFTNLGSLAGQGIGLGVQSAQVADQSYNQLGQQQIAEQQIQAEEKGSMLGAVSGLGGAAMGAFCPAEGSMYLMADNSERPVETLKLGEQIMGIDDEPQNILQIDVNPAYLIRCETENGYVGRNSYCHAFALPKGGFTVASKSLGKPIATADGNSRVISVDDAGTGNVYNVITDGSHTFRADGLWAYGVGEGELTITIEQWDAISDKLREEFDTRREREMVI